MCWTSVPLLASGRLAGEGWTVRKKHAECTSGTLVHAHQQLHPHGDAGVPAQRQQADVAGYDGWAQQVLYHGGAVRVPIEDLESRKQNCEDALGAHFIMSLHFHSPWGSISLGKLVCALE